MLVEADPGSSALRLDDAGVAALLAAAREPEGDLPAELLLEVRPERLATVLDTIAQAVATLELTVAGPEARLVHAGWLVPGMAVLRLAVRPGLHQLMTIDPAHLTAALVRATRMRPRRLPERTGARAVADPAALVAADDARRRQALREVGGGFAWHLELAWADGARSLTAADGPAGLHLLEPDGRLHPVSNTGAYRVLSTLLPPEAVAHRVGR